MRSIFVVGAACSGTTMMSRMLGNHPEVFSFNELHFFEELWDGKMPPARLERSEAIRLAATLLSIQREGYLARRDRHGYRAEASQVVGASPSVTTAPEVFAAYLSHETHKRGKTTACLQTPRKEFYLAQILGLYPEAMAVVMLRDPRAMLLSQKRRWSCYYQSELDLSPSFLIRAVLNYHPITYSLIWNRAIAAGEALREHARVKPVRFEAVLQSPEDEVKRICQFLGLEYSPEMLQIPRVGSSSRPDEPSRLALDPEVVERWKSEGLNLTEIWLCQRLTSRSMNGLGYQPESVRADLLYLIYYAVNWLPKSALAFVFNLRRTRSPALALRRRLGRASRSTGR